MSTHAALVKGNVAVITGAADGIGLAAAHRFAAFGMHVVMCDINADLLSEAAAGVAGNATGGATIEHRLVDVTDREALIETRNAVFEKFGHVDVLMNNAGTAKSTGSWAETDDWHFVINVNLWGVVNGVHAFTQPMIDQKRRSLIINTGSKQGITNPPGNPAYNVSKAGVKAATECLQHELRNIEGCLVSAHLLVPGFTYTGLVKRHVSEKPAAAWMPEEVVDYLIDELNRDRFYIICPDNEVSRDEDRRRVAWAAGDLIENRSALSRWDPEFSAAFDAYTLKT